MYSAAAVAHHAHLALGLLVAAPGAHDEGVVDGDAPDLVDPARLELVEVLQVARDVLGRAGGRERAGQAEDGDLLAGHELVDFEGIGADRAAGRLVFDELVERSGRQLVSEL